MMGRDESEVRARETDATTEGMEGRDNVEERPVKK